MTAAKLLCNLSIGLCRSFSLSVTLCHHTGLPDAPGAPFMVGVRCPPRVSPARPQLLSLLAQGTHMVLDRYSYSGVAYTAAKGLPELSREACRTAEVRPPPAQGQQQRQRRRAAQA